MALLAPSARAEAARVVVVEAEPKIAQALDVALSPWSLIVVRAPGPLPEPDIVTALARAHAIAGADHAGAVIWIEPPAGSSAHPSLWVYDAETQQLAVRPLGASPPFDEAGAAAVALSVKTILRGSALDASAKPLPAQPTPPPLPIVPRVPGRAVGVISAEGESGRQSMREPSWRMEADATAQAPTGGVDMFQLRAGLGVSVWPKGAARGHFGVGVNFRGGPGVTVDAGVFHGQIVRTSFEATARLRANAAPWLGFELQTGPALLVVALDGELRPTTQSAHSIRLDPVWDATGVVDLRLSPRLSVGAAVGASTVLRIQDYTVDGAYQVSTEPRVVGHFGVRVSVGVD